MKSILNQQPRLSLKIIHLDKVFEPSSTIHISGKHVACNILSLPINSLFSYALTF